MRNNRSSINTAHDAEDFISHSEFYSEYHGHKVEHLEKLLPHLRSSSDSIIWTAGDSSLDNKYWFNNHKPAVGAYKSCLRPPTSICDVTYWLNFLADQRNHDSSGNRSMDENKGHGRRIAAINTAVEASTLNERSYRLRPQDIFLRDNISREDTLVVSVGGNDVAMMPTPCTIFSMAGLLALPMSCIRRGVSCCTLPVNDCCCGCGPSTCSCLGSFPPCLGYFRHLFGIRVKKYIEKITSKTRPKRILVCMIYFLDEAPTPSWAGGALGAMGYNRNPAKLQLFIKKIFEEATSQIKIEGTEVIPIPLFNALDGKCSQDYVARVEPSAIGGKKMAEYLMDAIDNPASLCMKLVSVPSSSLLEMRR